ncbi:hypothetical protein PhCBS80983_g02926 [Powellomyces hirtus]|uniref:Large ribosomal subunit protein mL59 domain-containing protein n=1 Tax=Powellomyces hirtus TaxID=109895 RepID=A0A507E4Q9_9FUNG|nr:hypothetical protein PhCBS80983_g02926 [Powellomyces hirtus]
MKVGAKFPSRMPTAHILKQIAFPPPPTAFQPTVLLDGSVRAPQISIRDQGRIRKACRMAGLDAAVAVGLPFEEVKFKKAVQPKGNIKEIKLYEKEKKIAESMARMDERIAAWKEERRKAKESAKPEMPF